MWSASAAVLTAHRMYGWLIDRQHHLPAPLGTCRLLLSPSSGEVALEPKLDGLADHCTPANFVVEAIQWRRDAGSIPGLHHPEILVPFVGVHLA
jgi:hypothetical protein